MPNYNLKIALTSIAIILSTFGVSSGWLDPLPRYILIFLSLAALLKLYSENRSAGSKVIGIVGLTSVVFYAFMMLTTSKVVVGSYRTGSQVEDAPFWFVLMYSGLWLSVGWAFAKESFAGEYVYDLKEYKVYPAMINIDLINPDDHQRIHDIKERNDELYAYSREGATVAKSRAKHLGLETCFSKFLDKTEVDKTKPWNLK